MQFEDVIQISLFDLSDEERVGAKKFIQKLLDQVDCKIAIMYGIDNQIIVETYGMDDGEDDVYMQWLTKEIKKGGV